MRLDPFRWSHTTKLITAFATLYVVWGSTYLAIRIGLTEAMPPALFAGSRLAPAGIILLAFARARGVSIAVRLDEYRVIALVGLLLLVGGMYSTFLSERLIPSGLAALIVALLPLQIALTETVLGFGRPTRRGLVGLVLGFLGLGILMAPRIAGFHGTPAELRAVGIQMAGTWLWTAGSLFSKRHPVRTDALVATGYQMLTAGVVLLAIGTVGGEWAVMRITPRAAAALVYLTLIGSCVAFTAFVWLLRHVPAPTVMTYAYVNPVIAVFLGWLAGRAGLVPLERVDGWVLVGMVVIVTGVALTTSAASVTREPSSAGTPPIEA